MGNGRLRLTELGARIMDNTQTRIPAGLGAAQSVTRR